MIQVLCNGKCQIDPGCLHHAPLPTLNPIIAQAVVCPICYGKGSLHDPHGGGTALTKPCHGCGGKGLVSV